MHPNYLKQLRHGICTTFITEPWARAFQISTSCLTIIVFCCFSILFALKALPLAINMQSGEKQKEREHFIKAIRKFMQMERLTAPLLRELIDRIEVFETEGVGKNRTQRIVIYYRFVGYIELPEATPSNNYKADTRKGVSVDYLPKPLSA